MKKIIIVSFFRERFGLPKKGFTLAEVLITLLIIGVVAVITLPSFITKWQMTSYDKQKMVFEQKLLEATKQMNINGDLSPYDTTEAFVSKLKKYIKITQVCKSNNLSDCFPKSIFTDKGEVVDATKLTRSPSINKKPYDTANVGIKILNGVSAILSFDSNCEAVDPYQSIQSTTACLYLVYDVNGYNKPNVIGKDTSLYNAVLNIDTCMDLGGGLCVSTNDLAYPLPKLAIQSQKYLDYISQLGILPEPDVQGSWSDTNGDVWAASMMACEEIGMRLPTVAELKIMYDNQDKIPNLKENCYWSSEPYPSGSGLAGAMCICFGNSGMFPGEPSNGSRGNQSPGRCVKK